MIRKVLTEISSKYLEAKKQDLKGHPLADYIRKSANELIKPTLGDFAGNFLFRSSAGIHQAWADVPWISIMDPEVTTTTQTGYYVVYLFSVDMKKVALSLNQGITFLTDELGQKKAIQELFRKASFIRDRVGEYEKIFSDTKIDLSSGLSKSHRPKLYEPGHAFGTVYETNNIPNEDKLVNDLKKILELYILLTHRGGLDTNLSGTDFEPDNLKEQNLEERKKYRRHRSIERNPNTSKEVKKIRGYVCEACDFDFKKFYGDLSLNKKGESYIEAHHLTPLSSLPEGKALKFSAKDDFRVLCANCHRMVHRKNPPYTIEELKAKFKS
jgi:5-methylcytosine-specific restriction protein A